MLASAYFVRTTRTSLVYLAIGLVVLGISVGCLLALWFTQGFIYWYFVFGIIVGTGLTLYALSSLIAARCAGTPDQPYYGDDVRMASQYPQQVVPQYPQPSGRVSEGSNDFSPGVNASGRIDPNMYVRDSIKQSTPSPPLAYGSPVYLPTAPPLTPPGSVMGAPRFQEQAPAGSAPSYGAPVFQPGPAGDDQKTDEQQKVAEQIVLAAAPVQYGAPPPPSSPPPQAPNVRDF